MALGSAAFTESTGPEWRETSSLRAWTSPCFKWK